MRTLFESDGANGIVERRVASSRRDLLDHIIAVNERRLERLLSGCVGYDHQDRTHLGLGSGTPDYRRYFVVFRRVSRVTQWAASSLRPGCLIRTTHRPSLICMSPVRAHVSTRDNLRGRESTLDRMKASLNALAK